MLRIMLFGVLVWTMSAVSASAQSDLAAFFARLPAMESPALSPNGEALAYISHRGDEQAAVILDLTTGAMSGVDISNARAFGLFLGERRHAYDPRQHHPTRSGGPW